MHSASLLPVLVPLLLGTPQGKEPPPGMVPIKGGRTTIGTPVKDALRIGEETPEKFSILTRETPDHEVRVDDFYLMVAPVTNEQYHGFVKATGARVPEHWGKIAIDQAGRLFLEEQYKAKQAAKEAGKPVPKSETFDRARWWDKNWMNSDWGVPPGSEDRPVVFVSYAEASAFARWSGLRLMTEQEFQRAGRGGGKAEFPWGEKWEEGHCTYQNSRVSEPTPVGLHPNGVTDDGVFDLVGNVWEWTSSPFTAYPKFKVLQIEITENNRPRTIDGLVNWDANQRVAVGGSFQNPVLACRLSVRRATDRSQNTNSLGFRCAASITPGADMAQTILRDDLPAHRRPAGVSYDPDQAIATDRWQSALGTATTKNDEGDEIPVPGYAVITGYDHVLFMPVEKVDAVALRDLTELSHEQGPVQLGIFSTTRPAVEPELAEGTYMVAWRGAGKPRKSRTNDDAEGEGEVPDDAAVEAAAPAVAEAWPPEMDIEKPNFIFYDTEMKPVAFLEATSFDSGRPVPPRVIVREASRQIVVQDEEGKDVVEEEPIAEAFFKLFAFGKVSKKGYEFELTIQFAEGAIDDSWRTGK